ncbi:MAG: UDP-N-acetylglucosamine 2-epimerase (non-hydrolyzing) [Rubricoccaceae bacterium]|nr:UDP-N-acetylglucosamine 2-epimerase (non-hydrolyzing) [Rubricoccaceae bacterium]
MFRILSVVGARPNFVKVGALHRAFETHPDFESRIVHTGQHYDRQMSSVFFEQLELPEPHKYLGVGSGTHAEQTARVMVAFERVVLDEKPDCIVVVGDVNSTLAATIVCAKLHIAVAHVEAGLRSGDRSMPEEINRVATDAISDILYVTERSGVDNLLNEGVPADHICFAGNVMIDSLVHYKAKAEATGTVARLGLERGTYALMTMHRPATVDALDQLEVLAEAIRQIDCPIVFPIHPRTKSRLEASGLFNGLLQIDTLLLTEPMGYLQFLNLMTHAGVLITDSGGVQEETTFLGVPCITLRPNTERPVTVELGTNRLLPLDPGSIRKAVNDALVGNWPGGELPPLWDGKAGGRIASHLAEYLQKSTTSVSIG